MHVDKRGSLPPKHRCTCKYEYRSKACGPCRTLTKGSLWHWMCWCATPSTRRNTQSALESCDRPHAHASIRLSAGLTSASGAHARSGTLRDCNLGGRSGAAGSRAGSEKVRKAVSPCASGRCGRHPGARVLRYEGVTCRHAAHVASCMMRAAVRVEHGQRCCRLEAPRRTASGAVGHAAPSTLRGVRSALPP